jgi:hypothetical protein
MRPAHRIIVALFLLSGLCSAGVSSKRSHVPEVGEKLKKKAIPASAATNSCATSTEDSYPCFHPTIEGVEFLIAFSEKTLRVQFVHTDDKKFKTLDGLKVGDVINVAESSLIAYPAWEIYAPKTRDGWRPVVGFNLLCSDGGKGEFDTCDDAFRKSNPGKARIRGFSKGGYAN